MKIKTIILDCDGVILDSNMAYEKVIEKIHDRHGKHFSKKEILSHFGEHPKKVIEELYHKRDVEKIYKDYVKAISSRLFKRHIKIHPRTKGTLRKLKKNYTLVLASGSLRRDLHTKLRKFGLGKYFDHVISGDDVRRAKPDPAMIKKALRLTRRKSSEAIYVGDAPFDVKAAKRAKVKFVAVLSGVLNRKEAKRMKSDFIISDLSKIDRVLKGLKR